MSRNFRRVHKPDVVTLRVATVDGVLRITGSCVVGSAAPCKEEIQVGKRLSDAHACLVSHGFTRITERTNVRVYRRYHGNPPRPLPPRPKPCPCHHRPRPRPC
jgi:hypothetical protein